MILMVTMTYALHAIALPAGASPAYTREDQQQDQMVARQPMKAGLARNGQVAILLARADGKDQRILIVRPDGSRTILHFGGASAKRALASVTKLAAVRCYNSDDGTPDVVGVMLAREGTPFITVSCGFSGAYSGTASAALVWNGAWHVVPEAPAFKDVGKPYAPDNITMAAADTPAHFAFIGDYFDRFPAEDLILATKDVHYQADLSGVAFASGNVALGEGNATAMRGDFVAGFYADLKGMGTPLPPVAVLWRCPSSARPCTPYTRLGAGIAFGVDAHGTVVGDDEVRWFGPGHPMLWRNGVALRLSSSEGAAYAIGEDGTIAGVLDPGNAESAFVASTNEFVPEARPLDALIANRGGLHVERAVGVDDAGDILAYVLRPDGTREVALLTPQRHN